MILCGEGHVASERLRLLREVARGHPAAQRTSCNETTARGDKSPPYLGRYGSLRKDQSSKTVAGWWADTLSVMCIGIHLLEYSQIDNSPGDGIVTSWRIDYRANVQRYI